MSTVVDPIETAAAPEWRPRFNPWAIAMTVTLATFMEVLDTSIANVRLAAHRRQSFDQPG